MPTLLSRLSQVAHLLIRLSTGWVFVQSGWEKLHHLPEFYQAAQNYHILPPTLTHFYAVCVPWLEVLGGGYLLLGLFIPFAAALNGLLLLSFIIAISMVLIRGEAIDCGCFVGGRAEPVTPALLFRDINLLLGCIYLYWMRSSASYAVDCLLFGATATNSKTTI